MRLVGLHRDPETNRAYLQVQAHSGAPFDSIPLSQAEILTLGIDAVSMLRMLRENPAPPPAIIEAA